MPWELIIWTDANIAHIAAHGVAMEEFEQVMQQPLRIVRSRSSERLIAFGYTRSRRRLACVFETVDEATIHPVTAYEV